MPTAGVFTAGPHIAASDRNFNIETNVLTAPAPPKNMVPVAARATLSRVPNAVALGGLNEGKEPSNKGRVSKQSAHV